MPKTPKVQSSSSSAKTNTNTHVPNTPASGYVPGSVPSLSMLGAIGNSAALQMMSQTSMADSDLEEEESDYEEQDEDAMEWVDSFTEEQYEQYLERKEDGEARDYVHETLDYDSSDNESEMDEDTFVEALEQIYSVMEPYQDVDELKALSDRVAEDREDDNDMTQDTFGEVGRLHDNRQGVVSVRDNPILFAAHRDIIPIKSARKAKHTRIPLKYGDYRKKFNKSVPKMTSYLMKRNKFEEKIIAKRLKAKQAKAFKLMLKSKSLDLRNENDKPPALEHKINKAGKQGYPIGQVRSRNLVLVNDDRKYDEGPHPMMHSIKAAEGSGKTNYSRLDDDAGAAIAFGIRKGLEKRRLEKEEDEEEGSDTD